MQGVAYRAWAQETADELGLSGWVRNRQDGTVEALFAGEDEAVVRMIERCSEGPPGARVSAVRVVAEGEAALAGFSVRPTE